MYANLLGSEKHFQESSAEPQVPPLHSASPPRACDFFDLSVFSAYSSSCVQSPHKAVIQSAAEGTSAVPNYPCCSELFGHRSPARFPPDVCSTLKATKTFAQPSSGKTTQRLAAQKEAHPVRTLNPELKELTQTWGWKKITVHGKIHPSPSSAYRGSRAWVVERLRTA